MKTFLVYDLDTGLPIAVGEAIKAEWARVQALASVAEPGDASEVFLWIAARIVSYHNEFTVEGCRGFDRKQRS